MENMYTTSSLEGINQISTATADGQRTPTITRAQAVASDKTSYSSMKNPLDGNPNEDATSETRERMVNANGSATSETRERMVNANGSATSETREQMVNANGSATSGTKEHTVIANASATSNASSHVKDSDTNDDGLISEELWNAFNDVAGDLWLPVCAIGIVANIFNIIVFMDRQMRNATNYYLTAISLFQISYIVSSTVTKVHQLIYGDIGQRSTKFYYIGAIYVNNYIATVFSRAVFCMVMLVSLERMMAIVFPLRRARSRLVKSPIPCTLSLIVILFLFHLFAVLKYSVEPKTENGITSYDLKPRGYDMKVLITFSLISKILFVYVPLLSILICNTILCVALKRQSRRRNNLQEGIDVKRREARERQTTVAILVSTFVFLLLVLPITTNSIVSNLISSYSYFGKKNRYTFLFVQLVGGLSNLVSYSTDFITYVTISSKYRDTLVRKCFPCLVTPRMSDSTQSTMNRSTSTNMSVYSSDKG